MISFYQTVCTPSAKSLTHSPAQSFTQSWTTPNPKIPVSFSLPSHIKHPPVNWDEKNENLESAWADFAKLNQLDRLLCQTRITSSNYPKKTLAHISPSLALCLCYPRKTCWIHGDRNWSAQAVSIDRSFEWWAGEKSVMRKGEWGTV